jgi:putative transposase
VVGLDIGPGNIAAGGQTDAICEQFCPSIVQPWKELRRIERAMDRSKRANNDMGGGGARAQLFCVIKL